MSDVLEPTAAPAETPSEAPVEAAQPADRAGDSLRDVITRAYKESTATSETRPRDENGRFAGSGAAPEAPQAEPASTQATDQPNAPAPASERPDAWSETDWANLSPETRATVARRERDLHAALEQRAEHSQEVDRYRKAIAPHERRFNELGVTPPEAFARLLEWESAVRQDPANALQQLAKAVGYDLRNLVNPGQQSPQTQQEFRDPRLDRILADQERATQAERAREEAKISAQIDAFRTDSQNVHFEHVRDIMARLIDARPDLTLQEAYDRAVWSDPKLRADRIKAEADKLASDRRAEEAARAKAARSASISVRDSAPSGVNGHALNTQNMSLRETIKAAIGQASV